MSTRLHCPKCGQAMEGTALIPGATVRCTQCGQRITLNRPEGGPAPAEHPASPHRSPKPHAAFVCPKCDEISLVSEDKLGRAVLCPKCNERMIQDGKPVASPKGIAAWWLRGTIIEHTVTLALLGIVGAWAALDFCASLVDNSVNELFFGLWVILIYSSIIGGVLAVCANWKTMCLLVGAGVPLGMLSLATISAFMGIEPAISRTEPESLAWVSWILLPGGIRELRLMDHPQQTRFLWLAVEISIAIVTVVIVVGIIRAFWLDARRLQKHRTKGASAR